MRWRGLSEETKKQLGQGRQGVRVEYQHVWGVVDATIDMATTKGDTPSQIWMKRNRLQQAAGWGTNRHDGRQVTTANCIKNQKAYGMRWRERHSCNFAQEQQRGTSCVALDASIQATSGGGSDNISGIDETANTTGRR
ncbi:hypothetical protein GN244_ATG11766 [Phytophthora infestans]|uniref:Uncharacterized protein n=1 Tax=Phytophthora infestans TaxID=4787 RepID=A0A833SZL2_PHYIN|nr:hypothetical protein GN244_ATG11766 [Phytophthora infestans]